MENQEPSQSPDIPDWQKRQIESIHRQAALKAKWREEMQQNESIQNYLKGYNPISVKSFVEHYIDQKAFWHEYGPLHMKHNESEELQWVKRAFDQLAIIQQKKLFDMQCLWRAEKISIEDVELCVDFRYWEHDILNCPFVPPVNEEDIELYILYLQQNNAEVRYLYDIEWQDYDQIKESAKDNDADFPLPEWYDFHNGRKGKDVLLQLPDIRGEKEEFYLNIYHEHKREENKAKQEEAEKTRDKRPMLNYYGNEQLESFVNSFEDKETQKLYKEYVWSNRHSEVYERITEFVSLLLTSEEHVPIEAHFNWVEALEKAAHKFTCRKIAEALPLAWEQYMMNVETGIAFPNEKNYWSSIKEDYVKEILEGRKLNGEPEDLNF